ncbi:hypothetical protein BG842_08585 [Haladaptatus sp. W1]|uniref:hypothetical protein n=1 Tax=Haladaptatus sp. W1 TaxID=1897478 RepID=UPI000849CE8E|nr:hypothetical protein [Haladaptatus sp. W1]ODR79699.1 hypothetical protein BG842_08585 [Haladaptatus sp. W1]
MPGESRDPTAIRVVVVHADDVVTALEANERGREAVLRITAPFAGRVRARLHVVQESEPVDDGLGGPAPIRIPPRKLVAEDAPSYPRVDETDPTVADPDGEYDVEVHHDRHAAAVAAWRERVRDHLVEAVELDTAAGPHRVSVAVLG